MFAVGGKDRRVSIQVGVSAFGMIDMSGSLYLFLGSAFLQPVSMFSDVL